MTKKAWSGRFSHKEAPLMEEFNASISFDQELYPYDIQGSLAHAQQLHQIGVLNKTELKKMELGLKKILQEFQKGQFKINLADEDIHMAIENRLRKIIGTTASKLHTGRSRNDQVATATKLYVKDHTQILIQSLTQLTQSFVKLAKKYPQTILPGYTHLQRAQPILFAHHLLAYVEMFKRDLSRLKHNLDRLSECPLGSGALAGSTIALDRKLTARLLGFKSPTHNSLDSVSDRDFVLDYLYATSVISLHLSRFSEELIIWSSQEFQFIELPIEFCTGSSMMPQKVNPDAPELIRGKTGRVIGNLVSLMVTLKGLPLAYNKDMQEDKEPLFDTCKSIEMCLAVLNLMVPKMKPHSDNMLQATKHGFLLATDIADYLTTKNVPFRKAHEIVGKLVQHCLKTNKTLEELTLSEYQKHHKAFDKDLLKRLSIKSSVNDRNTYGGTSIKQVNKQIQKNKKL